MKNMAEIILEIKMQIRSRIPNCNCTYKGLKRKVDSFVSFGPNGFTFIEAFDLAEVPISGSVTVNIRFTVLARVDIDGNVKAQSYLGGNYGPLTIRYTNSEYVVDHNNAFITDLRD
jgi:hypothetical protein